MKIGIAGYGFVGQAVHSCVKKKMIEANAIEDAQIPESLQIRMLEIYDPPQHLGDIENLRSCDVIFCCLPTLTTEGKQDFTPYEDFFERLGRYIGVLVIKSTVLASNIFPYKGRFNIVMNPEFLNQGNFKEDFYNQKYIVLGGRVDHCRTVENSYREFFEFKEEVFFEYCTMLEAIELKYTHNVYHAYKVLFWNFISERCESQQRKLAELYSKITGNTFEMQNIHADGTPGYGGACFPKDVKAFHGEATHQLTNYMIKFNARLRREFPEDER